jgi:hypothetical protein
MFPEPLLHCIDQGQLWSAKDRASTPTDLARDADALNLLLSQTQLSLSSNGKPLASVGQRSFPRCCPA